MLIHKSIPVGTTSSGKCIQIPLKKRKIARLKLKELVEAFAMVSYLCSYFKTEKDTNHLPIAQDAKNDLLTLVQSKISIKEARQLLGVSSAQEFIAYGKKLVFIEFRNL